MLASLTHPLGSLSSLNPSTASDIHVRPTRSPGGAVVLPHARLALPTPDGFSPGECSVGRIIRFATDRAPSWTSRAALRRSHHRNFDALKPLVSLLRFDKLPFPFLLDLGAVQGTSLSFCV